jgi:hypothetical protein
VSTGPARYYVVAGLFLFISITQQSEARTRDTWRVIVSFRHACAPRLSRHLREPHASIRTGLCKGPYCWTEALRLGCPQESRDCRSFASEATARLAGQVVGESNLMDADHHAVVLNMILGGVCSDRAPDIASRAVRSIWTFSNANTAPITCVGNAR